MRFHTSAAFAVLLIVASSSVARSAPWLTFTEISYRPAESNALEFVEIYNLDAPAVHLRGWRLEGEIEFDFAKETIVGPRQCLVIARDVEAFRRRYPKVENVVGPFTGEIGNEGGELRLRNRIGALAAAMQYGRDASWDARADGTGHTLVLADPVLDATQPSSWTASQDRGGSPGVFERTYRRVPGIPMVTDDAEWSFFRGTQAPPARWSAADFDDSSWEKGRGGFGFGDNDDATLLEDMQGRYLSVFTRTSFVVGDPREFGQIDLLVDFDDGFVAFLNGTEIARANMGESGSEIVWDEPARGNREAGRPDSFPLGAATEVLRSGKNVLAVAGFNNDLRSSDMSLIVRLERKPIEKRSETWTNSRVRISEISTRTDARRSRIDSLEIHADDPNSLSPGELFVTDDARSPTMWKLPESASWNDQGFYDWDLASSATRIEIESPWLALMSSKGLLLDVFRWKAVDGDAAALGRFPQSSHEVRRLARRTPGAPNVLLGKSDLVLSEIHYHPIGDDAAAEFVEIHNRGKKPASLRGLRLRDAIRFDFDDAEILDPGAYLVVAKEPKALAAAHGLDPARVVGPFRGRLTNAGERLILENARGECLDMVEYSDRSPWPTGADGWGPSLELRDVLLDNSIANAWASSDEARRSQWQSVAYRAGAYVFPNMPPTSFQFLLLDAGECLVDDLKILDKDGKTVVEDRFDSSKTRWRAFGTHGDSRVEVIDEKSGNSAYRIVASGRGNSRHNYVSLDVDPAFQENATYSVSFRVRWLAGSPLLLTRTSGQGIAKTHRLKVPARGGSPGRANTRAEEAAPVVDIPRQSPVAPSSKDKTRFEVAISARSKVENAELHYRHERSREWSSVKLERGEQERFHASLPPQPGGRVEFAVLATDSEGRQGSYPPQGKGTPAQFAVDIDIDQALPTYTVLITDAEWEKARQRERLSNRLMDATLVVGKSRIFYNVGFRARGSGFTRGSRNWRLVFGSSKLGEFSQLTLDGQGRDPAKANERAVFWLLDQVDVPTPRQRYVQLSVPGHTEESGVYEDVEKINGDYLTRWFPKPKSGEAVPGRLHKIDDYWDFRPPAVTNAGEQPFSNNRGFGRGGFGGFGRRDASYVEAFLEFESNDPEDYRWNFPPRANGRDEDFDPLIELIRIADPSKTEDADFVAKVEKLIDTDEWPSVIAARTLANDWDTYGLSRGKNAYLYRTPSGRWSLLPWDSDLSWGGRGGFGGFGGFGGERPLISDKFSATHRLLSFPRYRRVLYSRLAFLATKRMDRETFSRVIREIGEIVGMPATRLIEVAQDQRERILDTLPRTELSVAVATRVSGGAGERDRIRIEGTVPILAETLRLGDIAGKVEFPDEKTFVATFELAPGSEAPRILRALDRDQEETASVEVSTRE